LGAIPVGGRLSLSDWGTSSALEVVPVGHQGHLQARCREHCAKDNVSGPILGRTPTGFHFHPFSGQALAVKRVTDNQGKRTPGVDDERWDVPKKKAQAIR
jgi:hypothetical protein